MNTDTIKSAMAGKFTEFNKDIKAELHNRLASHETIVNYASEMNHIQELKSKFQEIK